MQINYNTQQKKGQAKFPSSEDVADKLLCDWSDQDMTIKVEPCKRLPEGECHPMCDRDAVCRGSNTYRNVWVDVVFAMQ
jgi:hypothetical protein